MIRSLTVHVILCFLSVVKVDVFDRVWRYDTSWASELQSCGHMMAASRMHQFLRTGPGLESSYIWLHRCTKNSERSKERFTVILWGGSSKVCLWIPIKCIDLHFHVIVMLINRLYNILFNCHQLTNCPRLPGALPYWMALCHGPYSMFLKCELYQCSIADSLQSQNILTVKFPWVNQKWISMEVHSTAYAFQMVGTCSYSLLLHDTCDLSTCGIHVIW